MAITGNDDIIDWTMLGHVADAEIPLLDAALLIARDEYPDLDVNDCRAVLGAHAAAVSARVRDNASLPHALRVVNAHLFEEVGYRGNHEDFYDPRNSYLNEVLSRRLGIPLTLALIQMQVTRRIGVAIEGVSFPGHFLLRVETAEGLIVLDPYNNGRALAVDELRLRAAEHLGGQLPDNRQLLRILEPVSNRGMLIRMLRNLKAIYSAHQDWERVSRSCDRILRIAPSEASELRDRGLAYLRLGHTAGARADLCAYLAACPADADAHELRRQLVEASSHALRLN